MDDGSFGREWRLPTSVVRRGAGLVVLVGLAGLLLWMGLVSAGTAPRWRVVLTGLGLVALWAGPAMWIATARTLVFDGRALVEDGGRVLARLDEIRAVDRGMFAVKPSNGFVLRLAQSARPAWAPGLWWRIGPRIGVGGVTSPGAAKAMADAIAMQVAARGG